MIVDSKFSACKSSEVTSGVKKQVRTQEPRGNNFAGKVVQSLCKMSMKKRKPICRM